MLHPITNCFVHNFNYIIFEHDLVGPDQITSAKTPLAIQPEISLNESTSVATENENTYDKLNTLQPYANVQLGELHRDFAKLFSTGDNMSKVMILPQKRHSTSTTFSPENETNPSENQTNASQSKSLQHISDNGQFLNINRETSPSDLDAPAHGSSQNNFLQVPASENQTIMSLSKSLQNINRETSPSDLDAPAHASCQNNFLQVPAMATNAVMTETSLAIPKSTSFLDTTNEEIYDNVCDLVSPIYCTLPSGWSLNCVAITIAHFSCIIYL